jgi:AcrR family transcriptional regulator
VKTKGVDRRVQRTQQLLHGALMSLVQEKGYEALTVQDIIDRANVGRATFYAHFDSKEDLLASGIEGLRASLKERQRQALADSPRNDARLFAFSHELFTHANEPRAVFRAMVGKRSGAVVQQLLQKMLVDLVRDEVKELVPVAHANAIPIEAIAQFVGGGLFGLLMWWGNGKMRMPVEEIDAAFKRLAIPSFKVASGLAM